MALQTSTFGDAAVDLWRKAVHNQVEQNPSSGLEDAAFADSKWDLIRKFVDNQVKQG